MNLSINNTISVMKPQTFEKNRAWLSIDTSNLLHNVKELQGIMKGDCKLMAVVKANAYGHGSVETAASLNNAGIKNFAVATLNEGIELRLSGIRGEILVLGYTDVSYARELKEYRLTQTVVDYSYGIELESKKIPVNVHIKIDTGMRRLGMESKDLERIREIFSFKYLNVTGMFTHLCAADSRSLEDIYFTEKQTESFYRLVDELKAIGIKVPVHVQSSYGLLNYNELPCDYARIGIAMYGCLSSAKDKTVIMPDLKPVLSLQSRLVLIRNIPAGESVGYGRVYQASEDRTIGILSIGYGDGYPRELSEGKGEVLIKGVKVPVIGRICMDQLMIDITGIQGIKRGDIATLMGGSANEMIPADEVADSAGTIANELLSRLGNRLPRIYTR
ncbi:serine racemase VanT catalytic subunit [Clostridium sp. KNHs205]|uniref:serine racemase VanT catalytic subunit n=1 Tax=Clostridium sp. KNHs205 TaxID=1449050 RepID=UPI000A44C95F|nr:serine racemase VanT catalytic subunit [Clostridium sp. KNHs205]